MKFSFPQEIIQNAEDAGATELVLVLDKNFDNDPRNNYSNEGLRKYQVIQFKLYVSREHILQNGF